MPKSAAVLLLTTALIACQDASGPEGARLTRPEALRVAGELAQNGSAATSTGRERFGSLAVASPPTRITTDHNSSFACPKGGKVLLTFKATAVVDVEASSFELDIDGKQTHQGCAFDHERVTLTITGDPSLDFDAHAAVKNGQPNAGRSSFQGKFKWSASDGRSGTCPVALNTVTDFAARKHTITGDVCGHAISETTTWQF